MAHIRLLFAKIEKTGTQLNDPYVLLWSLIKNLKNEGFEDFVET